MTPAVLAFAAHAGSLTVPGGEDVGVAGVGVTPAQIVVLHGPGAASTERSFTVITELEQYTSKAFTAIGEAAGVRLSMSKIGSSADNALAEAFNATFKRETLQGRRAFTDEREARLSSFRWLHRYNTVRRHSRLGQRSPIDNENTIRPAPAALAPAE